MSNYDPLITIAALNMFSASLYKITTTKNISVLEQEYRNIIQNIRIDIINPDAELVNLYQDILNAIRNSLLRHRVLESTPMEKRMRKSRLTERVFTTFSSDLLRWFFDFAASCVSEYFREEELEAETKRVLMDSEFEEYSSLQSKLFTTSWTLMSKYKIKNCQPIRGKLDELSINLHVSDPLKRLRRLTTMEEDFSMYSPYWFYRAVAARESAKLEEVANCCGRFHESWRPVLIKDSYMVEILKAQINEITSHGLNEDNITAVLYFFDIIQENMTRDDWENNIYAGFLNFILGKKTEALGYIRRNIDLELELNISSEILERITKNETSKQISAIVKHIENKKRELTLDKWRAFAQNTIGNIYQHGKGVMKSYRQAVYWYRLSAQHKYSPALNNLGNMYRRGRFFRKNIKRAISNYTEAAQYGNTKAYYNLGEIYYFGAGVERDCYKAIQYYIKAAENGNTDAQYSLGVIYDKGDDVERDYTEAIRWYQMAAEHGDIRAQNNLGCIFCNNGNYVKAEYWFRRASELGDIYASENLKAMLAGSSESAKLEPVEPKEETEEE